MTLTLRHATERDIPSITEIYNYYISNTAFTFEEETVSVEEMRARVRGVQGLNLPWLVAIDDNRLAGYAYATPWKARSAYRFSVESTVYVDPKDQGRSVGSSLYKRLFVELKEKGINSVAGGITLPNPVSVALHEKLGMKKVAHFERVGYKFEQWRDVGYWQINLNGVAQGPAHSDNPTHSDN